MKRSTKLRQDSAKIAGKFFKDLHRRLRGSGAGGGLRCLELRTGDLFRAIHAPQDGLARTGSLIQVSGNGSLCDFPCKEHDRGLLCARTPSEPSGPTCIRRLDEAERLDKREQPVDFLAFARSGRLSAVPGEPACAQATLPRSTSHLPAFGTYKRFGTPPTSLPVLVAIVGTWIKQSADRDQACRCRPRQGACRSCC
ncbi:hypothetical protein SAMN05216330_11923 [Bradyrhizobium sp. Ghvi]|nr:hypothetical protein SAMN05216330_11923 [Bradyrhizobium sp. Ghvi]